MARNFSVTLIMPVAYSVNITAAVIKVADNADNGTDG